MASSSDQIYQISSTATKESSSQDGFEKSRNGFLNSSSTSLSEVNSSPDFPLRSDPIVKKEEEKSLLQFGQGNCISFVGDDDYARINNGDFQKHAAESSVAARDESPSVNYNNLPVKGDSNSDTNNSVNLALESPPNQVMERSSYNNNSPTGTATTTETTPSPYRIPSHVFKRSNTNTPVEWSLTSNESLFSIQMGNMSFARNNFLLRLDDVGTLPDESPLPSGNLKVNNSGQLPPPTPQPRVRASSNDSKSVDSGELGHGEEGTGEVVPKQSTTADDDVKVNPTAPAPAPAVGSALSQKPFPSHRSAGSDDGKSSRGKINKETDSVSPSRKDFGLMGNNSDVAEKRLPSSHISRMSAESNNSTKSFAFPILDGGVEKCTSISMTGSPVLGKDPLKNHNTQQVNKSNKQQQVVTNQRKSEFNNSSSPEAAATQPKRNSGWCSCLSCWPCCR